jgi:hypothetical protein
VRTEGDGGITVRPDVMPGFRYKANRNNPKEIAMNTKIVQEIDDQIINELTARIFEAIAQGAHTTVAVETAVLGPHPYFHCDGGLFNRAFRRVIAEGLVRARNGIWLAFHPTI